MAVPTAGGPQETTLLRLDLVNGWLFGIEPNMVRADRRERVLDYQRECYRALFQHFYGQALAARPKPAPRLTVAEEIDLVHRANTLRSQIMGSTDPALRRERYGELLAVYDRRGLADQCPPLDRLGEDAPPPEITLAPFWDAVAALLRRGQPINHSDRPGELALHLPSLEDVMQEQGLRTHWLDDPEFQAALVASPSPRFRRRDRLRSPVWDWHPLVLCHVFDAPAG
jgi:hypothetical protein